MSRDSKPIDIVGASAGTGKTHRLALDFCEALAAGVECPTEIIATTFTKKAATELAHRIRRFLLQQRKWHHAQSIYAAHIGTVNSVCGKLVSDLSIDAGLSPSIRVIDDIQQTEIFSMAIEEVTSFYASKSWASIYRLGLESKWRDDIRIITDLARQNRLDADTVRAFANSSWISLERLLPPSISTDSVIDELAALLKNTISKLPATGDDTKMTATAVAQLREIDRAWSSQQDMTWENWVKISKIKTGKLSAELMQPLTEKASLYDQISLMRLDLKNHIEGVFECVADCLEVYSLYKSERGLFDFIDQEEIALSALSNEAIKDALNNRFRCLVVDEFQDTSPIQLAVFLELSKLVDRSIWVGDQKQSIFGFRGADPLLMQEVVNKLVPASGGKKSYLTKSYRSRPALVEFTNQVFTRALEPLGFSKIETEIEDAVRKEHEDMNDAIHLWWLEGKNNLAAAKALARGVQGILDDPLKWPISSGTDTLCKVKGKDIAILCRTNGRRLEVADALADFGISVATERTGLLESPECILTLAVLRYLNDPYDTLAMAEIVRFSDTNEDDSTWLRNWLDQGYEEVRNTHQCLQSIDKARREVAGLTPLETLQYVSSIPFILETLSSWPSPRQRFMNLEALTGVAGRYENSCSFNRQSASISGLLTYLSSVEKDSQQPPNPDDQAVNVLTYHKAKGLEWPIVVLYDLATPTISSPFGVSLIRERPSIDLDNPLSGRSIRYWPWPFGAQKSGIELGERAYASPEMKARLREEEAENARLLYVGMTRPRDYMILACRTSKNGAGWLEQMKDKSGVPIFELSREQGRKNIVSGSKEVVAQSTSISALDEEGGFERAETIRYFLSPKSCSTAFFSPYSYAPSSLRQAKSSAAESTEIRGVLDIGDRLSFSRLDDMVSLGNALHHFLAWDNPASERTDRLSVANRIAASYGLESKDAMLFLEASERLSNSLEALYPDARWLKEWPVSGRREASRVSGTIDLCLELTEGYVIIDHKSFPGPFEQWEQKAQSYYPQINAYAELVSRATGKSIIDSFIHLPVVGKLLKFETNKSNVEETILPDEGWIVL